MMIQPFQKNKKVIFEKGDTIGGTAPLLLMHQISGGQNRRTINNRRRRRKPSRLGNWLSGLVSLSLLASFLAAGLAMLDWGEGLVRLQILFGLVQ